MRSTIESIERLAAMAKREHYTCDGDSWFSCPKTEGGCSNPAMGSVRECGADRHNLEVDGLVNEIQSILQEN